MRARPDSPARHSRTQYLIAALVPALIVTLSITGFVWAHKPVTVVVDGRSEKIETQASTVGEALSEAGVRVDSKDVVTPAADEPVAQGMTVVVRHSVPITLDLGGTRVEMDVVGETVADALVAAGVNPSSNPAVSPHLDSSLEPSMVVSVPDAFLRVVSEEGTIAPPVKTTKDASLPKGTKRIVTTGVPGSELLVYRMLVASGVEGPKVLTARQVVKAAVPQVVAVGTGQTATGSFGEATAIPEPPATGREMRVEATGYSPQEPGLDYTTATGARATRGVIAVDPKLIPLGTRVYVPGYGYAIAADTGGAIDGHIIDLCFPTVAEAIQWGRRTVTIIILD